MYINHELVDDDLDAKGHNVVELGPEARLAVRLEVLHAVWVHGLVGRLVHVGHVDDGIAEHGVDARSHCVAGGAECEWCPKGCIGGWSLTLTVGVTEM